MIHYYFLSHLTLLSKRRQKKQVYLSLKVERRVVFVMNNVALTSSYVGISQVFFVTAHISMTRVSTHVR